MSVLSVDTALHYANGTVYGANWSVNKIVVGHDSSIVTQRIEDPAVLEAVESLGSFAYFIADEREKLPVERLAREKALAVSESGILQAVASRFVHRVDKIVVGRGGAFEVISHRNPTSDVIPTAQPAAQRHFHDIAAGPWAMLQQL